MHIRDRIRYLSFQYKYSYIFMYMEYVYMSLKCIKYIMGYAIHCTLHSTIYAPVKTTFMLAHDPYGFHFHFTINFEHSRSRSLFKLRVNYKPNNNNYFNFYDRISARWTATKRNQRIYCKLNRLKMFLFLSSNCICWENIYRKMHFLVLCIRNRFFYPFGQKCFTFVI